MHEARRRSTSPTRRDPSSLGRTSAPPPGGRGARFIRLLIASMAVLAIGLGVVAVSTASARSVEAVSPTEPLVRPEEGEVWRLYLAALGRRPDPDGFGYWVAERVEGVPLRVVADNFLASREFEVRFGATSDREFVDLVYRHVLGRAGDPSGADYWHGVLAGGHPRADVVLLFAESDEHRVASGTVLPLLPPFAPVVRSVLPDELGDTWRPGCPVDPDDLRTVELDHVGPTGEHRRGRLVVHRDVTADIAAVFAELYAARFPIASMVPIADHGGDDDASMAAGNTSAFNCRTVTGGSVWSRHAYGRAVDLNPIQNPYVNGDAVLPPAGTDHVDRSRYHPAMIRRGDVVTRAFADRGWRWGGDFTSLADYQHFQR